MKKARAQSQVEVANYRESGENKMFQLHCFDKFAPDNHGMEYLVHHA